MTEKVVLLTSRDLVHDESHIDPDEFDLEVDEIDVIDSVRDLVDDKSDVSRDELDVERDRFDLTGDVAISTATKSDAAGDDASPKPPLSRAKSGVAGDGADVIERPLRPRHRH